jgi:hypothetical protein
MCARNPRPKGANGDGAERGTAVGARPTVTNPGGTDRCTAVGTEAAALGALRRGIIAAEIAGRRNDWSDERNAKS